jgi:hypothetical protein
MNRIVFSVAAYLVGFFIFLVLAMFSSAWMRGLTWRRRTSASAALLPGIREALVDYLAGSNDLRRLRAFLEQSRQDVATAILEFRNAAGGEARDRLCELALNLTLVHDWCHDAKSRDVIRRRNAFTRLAFVCSNEPCQRIAGDLLRQGLDDPDLEVFLAAARALIQSGNMAEVEEVFVLAVSRNLFIRILLAEDLRRYGMELCQAAIPEIFRNGEPQRILAALELLIAWERALPIENMARLMEHPDRRLRIQALRVAPLVACGTGEYAAITCALDDSDAEIAMAAAAVAGRLRIDDAVPALARCVRRGPAQLARTAGAALAEISPLGCTALEQLGAGGDPTSSMAADALSRVRAKETV